jgi:hypothetical protein
MESPESDEDHRIGGARLPLNFVIGRSPVAPRWSDTLPQPRLLRTPQQSLGREIMHGTRIVH